MTDKPDRKCSSCENKTPFDKCIVCYEGKSEFGVCRRCAKSCDAKTLWCPDCLVLDTRNGFACYVCKKLWISKEDKVACDDCMLKPTTASLIKSLLPPE